MGSYRIVLHDSNRIDSHKLTARCATLLDTQPDVAAVSAMQINRDGLVHYDVFDTFGKIRRYFYIVPQRPFFQRWLYRLISNTVYNDPNETAKTSNGVIDWNSTAGC